MGTHGVKKNNTPAGEGGFLCPKILEQYAFTLWVAITSRIHYIDFSIPYRYEVIVDRSRLIIVDFLQVFLAHFTRFKP